MFYVPCSMTVVQYFTKEGLQRLKDELKDLKTNKVNDEGAWLVSNEDKEVFDIVNKYRFEAEKKFKIRVDIGIDSASSTLFNRGKYNYTFDKFDSKKHE